MFKARKNAKRSIPVAVLRSGRYRTTLIPADGCEGCGKNAATPPADTSDAAREHVAAADFLVVYNDGLNAAQSDSEDAATR